MKKKPFIIAIIIGLVLLILGAVFLLRSQKNTEYVQTETVIDISGNGRYVMDDYAYGYGINTDTYEHFIECIDYSETATVLPAMYLSEPSNNSRMESEEGLELWIEGGLCLDNKDRLVCLFSHCLFEKSEGDTYIQAGTSEIWLYFYDKIGNYQEKLLLDKSLFDDTEALEFQSISQGKNGAFYLMAVDAEQGTFYLFTMDEQGNLIETDMLEYASYMYQTADGYTILRSGHKIRVLEENCPYKEKVDKLKVDMLFPCFGEGDYVLTYQKGNTVYGVTNTGDKEVILENEGKYTLYETEGCVYRNECFYLIHSGVGEDTRIIKLAKGADTQQVDDREVIYLATTGNLTESESFIQTFNRTNKEYKVEVVSYYEESDPQKALAEDILTGSRKFDILDLSGMDVETFVEKELLVNIYDFIEKDEELNREDFNDNILEAYETEGALYKIVPMYYIGAVITDNDKAEAMGGWSYETMWQMALEEPQITTNYEMFYYSLMAQKDNIYDEDTKTCDFSGEWLRGVLESGCTLSDIETVAETDVLEQLEIRGFASCIVGFRDISYLSAHNASEDKISLRGIPGENGDICYIKAAQEFGICANSDKKDAAWEVCRMLFTREYQVQNGFYSDAFVTRTDAMEQIYKTMFATEGYEDDVLGYVEPLKLNSAFGVPMENVTLGPVKENDVHYIADVMDNVYVESYRETMVYSMAWEEAKLFYENRGNLENTIHNMDNRVSLYLSE